MHLYWDSIPNQIHGQNEIIRTEEDNDHPGPISPANLIVDNPLLLLSSCVYGDKISSTCPYALGIVQEGIGILKSSQYLNFSALWRPLKRAV